MDAVAFLKAAERRSQSNPDYYGECISLHDNDWVALVAQVEQWAKDHPRKTRQSEFLKMFPDAAVMDGEVLPIAPCKVDKKNYDMKTCNGLCTKCYRDYWLQNMEES